MAVIERLIPQQNPDPDRQRTPERPTLNGIVFGLKTGYTWEDAPPAYGLPVM